MTDDIPPAGVESIPVETLKCVSGDEITVTIWRPIGSINGVVHIFVDPVEEVTGIHCPLVELTPDECVSLMCIISKAALAAHA